MSRTPAAQLARLKLTYPLWQIGRVTLDGQEVFEATKGRQRLLGTTPAHLEIELIRTDKSYHRA